MSRSKRFRRLMAASSASSRRATWSRCTRSEVRVNRTFQPLSSRLSPIADDRCDLPPQGVPTMIRLAPLRSHPSPAHSAETCALEIIGTASKSKVSSVLPGSSRASFRWRSIRRLSRSAISCSASAMIRRAAAQPSLSARSAKAGQICLTAGSRKSLSSSDRRVASKSWLMLSSPDPG